MEGATHVRLSPSLSLFRVWGQGGKGPGQARDGLPVHPFVTFGCVRPAGVARSRARVCCPLSHSVALAEGGR